MAIYIYLIAGYAMRFAYRISDGSGYTESTREIYWAQLFFPIIFAIFDDFLKLHSFKKSSNMEKMKISPHAPGSITTGHWLDIVACVR